MADTARVVKPTARLSLESHRMYVALDYVTLVGITAHIGFVPLFWWMGVPWLAGFNVLSVGAWVTARYVNRRGKLDLAVVLVKLEVAAHATIAVSLLGWDSGFHFYLWPLIPFAGLNDRISPKVVFIEVVALFILYSVLYWFTREIRFVGPSQDVTRAIPFMNVGVVFTAMGMLAVYFRLATATTERRLKLLASTDELTGLTNRRRMLEHIREELVRMKRSGKPAALVMADIDHFKQVNDRHGHQAGDVVLIGVSDELRERLRSQDFISRWGGEEFLFLLPETEVQGALVAAEKLRAAVGDSVIEFNGKELKVNMTFGVAPLDPAVGIDESISRADNALYEGKKAGRNRVTLWQPAPT
ncbi:MAG: diguanylate cyclase [Planctomycetes bacterium]|nr:diguanylate cyclase [Planctomycetota bacterium]